MKIQVSKLEFEIMKRKTLAKLLVAMHDSTIEVPDTLPYKLYDVTSLIYFCVFVIVDSSRPSLAPAVN